MAKKTKKTKITETIVTQFQEQPSQELVVEKKEAEIYEEEKEKIKPILQSSKLFDTPKISEVDSEISGINFGLSGIL